MSCFCFLKWASIPNMFYKLCGYQGLCNGRFIPAGLNKSFLLLSWLSPEASCFSTNVSWFVQIQTVSPSTWSLNKTPCLLPEAWGVKCYKATYLLASENTASTLPWELKAHVTKGFFPFTFFHHVSLLPELQSCHFNTEWIKECMFYCLFHTVQISSFQLPSFIQPQFPSHQRGRISLFFPFYSMAFFDPTAAL